MNFSASQIPTGSGRVPDTVERFIVWGALALVRAAGTKKYLRSVAAGEEIRLSVERFSDANGVPVVRVILVFDQDNDQIAANAPDWMSVSPIAASSLPSDWS